MVDPEWEICKQKFATSAFFTLILIFVSQLLTYPASLIPSITLAVLAFGYLWGKRHADAYPLGVFFTSTGATIYLYVTTRLGIYREALLLLAFLAFVIIGIAFVLPKESDWTHIRGWKKE